MDVIDASDFLRIVADWTVFSDLKQAGDPNRLKKAFKSAI
jgi:hypothetical protein